MLKKIVFVGISILITLSFSQVPDTLWTKTYGGTGYDRCCSVHQTTDGGYILGATTESYGAGNLDFWLIKTNPVGDTLWTKTYGGDSTESAKSVHQTTDGGYIVAGYTKSFGLGFSHIYLVKTDSLGDSIWTKTFEPRSVCYDMQQTTDTGYIIAGAGFIGSGEDLYLIKTDPSGDTIWTKWYGGTWASDLAWSIQQTSDSGYIIVGFTASFGAGSYDIWLLKTDENGDTLWTKTYGGTSWDYGFSIDQTTDGGYIVTGRTNSFCVGYSDVWLLRTNPDGDTLWTKTYGGMGCEGGRFVQQTSDGGFIVAGYTDSYGAGDYDVWILKTNSAGDTLWTQTYGGTGIDQCNGGGQQTLDDGYVFSAVTTSFGVGPSDAWLIRMEPDTFGVKEQQIKFIRHDNLGATIFSGPLILPEGKNHKIFDITGRIVVSNKMRPGIYFIEIDGKIIQKIIKIR
jgi:hypothetical protein